MNIGEEDPKPIQLPKPAYPKRTEPDREPDHEPDREPVPAREEGARRER
jgi:hypothetical protein